MKYSRQAHTEILYRHQRKRKKKRSNIKKRIKKLFTITVITLSMCAMLIIAVLLFTRNSPIFNIKNINTIISNDPDIVAPELFNHLKGNNIFSMNYSSIDSIISEKSMHYGLQAIIREYPSDLKIVLYKRIPVVSLNREYTIYQDFSMKHIACNANVIDMTTDIGKVTSPYDIPGFASIFPSLLKQHKNIDKIILKNGKYTIYTDNSVSIIMKPGNKFPDIDGLPDEYRYVDVRFRNTIYVK